ncbi:MAG TPA: SDR family oxidoreductase [Anaerolineae bacterium]|nr:SDR family oxidoreductase [Anaerolineae bacterium]
MRYHLTVTAKSTLCVSPAGLPPGFFIVVADMTAPLQCDPERGPAILERIPVGRWGQPEDLQGAVVFLVSAASDYFHGVIIPVDGGWLAR